MELKIITCHNCRKELQLNNSIGFQDTCEFCNEYLHCCLHCKIYDTNSMKCTSFSADKQSSEINKNYCEEFMEINRSYSNDKNTNSKSKLNALFKEETKEDNSTSLDKLNNLFKKD
ncbi:MAG: hypothetical protein COA79_00040 [Planctomycetota bacterium]|nr:MAG: hypothetical protein COA79_00040 [Planctomycetota bacterium]